ncbi:YqgE/AlgH family protein [Planctomycetota bacterium]
MNSLRGHLLIASPVLPDPNFCRSVVLIIDHDVEGAFGLILNRTTKRCLGDIWAADEPDPLDEMPIAVGGPVPGPILVLHGNDPLVDPGERSDQIIHNVCLTKVDDDYHEFLRGLSDPYRVFIGYAGWGSGQLESEIDSGSWLNHIATFDDIFHLDEGNIWEVLVARAQTIRTQRVLRVKTIGDDPSLN